MEILLYTIYFFILGACMGSFFTVVGFRLPIGESIIKPKRSYCPNCKNALTPLELFPIFSYIIQGGKCKHCKKPIGFIYPMIELFSGLLYGLSFYSFGFSIELLISLVVVSLLMIVIITDINYLIIPDEVTYTCAILVSILEIIKLGIQGGLVRILCGIILFVFMYLLMLLGNLLFHKESLGGADIKLMYIVGVVLSPLMFYEFNLGINIPIPVLGLLVIFLSSFIALPTSIILLISNKEHVIPYGPFIMIAFTIIYLMKVDVSTLMNVFLIMNLKL